ncbi:MAG TPA: adenosine kinase [Alphaproteobacteria bacterium]|nr:adenosine kinase [Alphaproteobacteria bacterium]
MTDRKPYDVVALSALCVDIQSAVPESEITRHGLKKGLTNQVSPETVRAITLGDDAIKTPGSPGGNVAGGIALRGGKVALIGKIANDEAGVFITRRLQSHDVDFTPVVSNKPDSATNAVMVLTTPDRERSFAFASGAAYELTPEDIDATLIAKAKITYLDSYLWLSDSGQDAVAHAAALAKQSGGKVAMALNDAALVGKNQEKYLALAKSHADILVGDRKEFMALFGVDSFEAAAEKAAAHGFTAAITAGAKGADVIENGVLTHVPARKIENIVDTNGAGDQFAAGFIYGLAEGKSAPDSAAQGALWASEVIQHRGAEPQVGKNARSNIPPAAPKPPRAA